MRLELLDTRRGPRMQQDLLLTPVELWTLISDHLLSGKSGLSTLLQTYFLLRILRCRESVRYDSIPPRLWEVLVFDRHYDLLFDLVLALDHIGHQLPVVAERLLRGLLRILLLKYLEPMRFLALYMGELKVLECRALILECLFLDRDVGLYEDFVSFLVIQSLPILPVHRCVGLVYCNGQLRVEDSGLLNQLRVYRALAGVNTHGFRPFLPREQYRVFHFALLRLLTLS